MARWRYEIFVQGGFGELGDGYVASDSESEATERAARKASSGDLEFPCCVRVRITDPDTEETTDSIVLIPRIHEWIVSPTIAQLRDHGCLHYGRP